MASPRPSVFRDALQISQERVAHMTDTDLGMLMRELLLAESYLSGAPIDEVQVNTEEKAKDDGCDGWSGRPVQTTPWLGSEPTCWQFKAGVAGQPGKLAGEVTKRIPAETLRSGGRFVVVASGSENGKKGMEDRLAALTKDAAAAGLPTEKIYVFGSERVTTWCNQHPAIAARWAGRPEGLCTLAEWANFEVHQVPWQASDSTKDEMEKRRADLDFLSGTILHLHIEGPPGVGKTRFALELCKGASWRTYVVYVRQATEIGLLELLDGAAQDQGVRLVVVADEVQPNQLEPLNEFVGRGDGRVRLITVGHSPSPDPSRIPALSIRPLRREEMQAVVRGLYPAMPPEHIDFIVRFAAGYVRLGRLAADAVAREGPIVNVRALLDKKQISGFLDRMLGTDDRRALYVVAALTHVGWSDDQQVVGMAIAAHLGQDWADVRVRVANFQRQFGIAPHSGRYRYISPTPLGIYLAIEVWETLPDLMKSLPDRLPTLEAKNAYFERLKSIGSSPQAGEFADRELAFFFRIEHFDDQSVKRWAALASANPPLATSNVLRALWNTSVEARQQLAGVVRRTLVWTLIRLSWGSSTFHDAALALALLAEAENERWTNNASGEFVAKFQIALGGTAVPYLQRLSVLERLLELRRPTLTNLVIKALAEVGRRQSTRNHVEPELGTLPEPEWQPTTWEELAACQKTAISMLIGIANTAEPELQTELVSAAQDLSMMLRHDGLRDSVSEFMLAVRGRFPDTREALRRIIASIVVRERKYWKELSPEQLGLLDKIHELFEDASFSGRLKQLVGVGELDRDDEVERDFSLIAKELVASPELLEANWPWLTSGDAADGWRLGEALAAADLDGTLEHSLPNIADAGRDQRVLCAYINARRRAKGDHWYDDWARLEFDPPGVKSELLFEVAWRSGLTEYMATSLILPGLKGKSVSAAAVGQLAFGRWDAGLSKGTVETVLRAMIEGGYLESAFTILARRLQTDKEPIEDWESLALQLALAPQAIRGRQMVGYYWKVIAKRLVAKYARELAEAIFQQQNRRGEGQEGETAWFVEHSDAAEVLQDCLARDADGVWTALQTHLSSDQAYLFILGLPKGLLELLPPAAIHAWISEQPEKRAALAAHLVSKDLSSDTTLAAQILEQFGHNENVASAFFSEYVSGSWWGPASEHWEELAADLEKVACETKLPRLKQWALESARSLHSMADRDRQREDEERLRDG